MQPTKIVEIGGEGGSIALYGWQTDKGKWRFLRETNEHTILDMMKKNDAAGIESQVRSDTVSSWKGALKILSRYPWKMLYPLYVHPEFADLVWQEIENMKEECYSRDEWENVCGKRPSRHTVCFSHGKESGPWGAKITALAEVAKAKGFNVVSVDYKGEPDPDYRAKRLCCEFNPSDGINVLVGSSLGGYVATVASRHFSPDGLFLMAPAFGMKGYRESTLVPCARKICVVHGLHDDVVPYLNSMEFAVNNNAQFHLLDDGHQLVDSIPIIGDLLARFLDSLLMYQGK